ncbi:NADH-dependent flavin oxidoreductase [Lutibacter sp. B1]|uniref:NADH-dependent flavin oxidoreductase n=1 Tax=Lutibacter sp. B1 TaxID=2725996 RepID=UPI00145772A2|nr:NADH-dependent flavin oxidoreductase [Lutibacter sp. B1]NLP57280.1 NADH-dependent flavin oxidoreductase [Lutibacter sp. B1]
MSNSNFKNILSPFTFPVSGIKLDSRVVMAPMTTFSGNEDGTVSDSEIVYYRKRNKGAELLITACAYVTREGKGFHGQIGAHTDEMIPSLKRIADTLKENGGKAVIQIYHGGRMCPPDELLDKQSISASAVAAEREDTQVPRKMTEDEIIKTIQAYGDATRRAIEAGFDGVEIHGANTYLIQQFFSPHSNRRTDKWGGSLEKRMTFPLAVINAVKQAVKENAKTPFLIGYRISPEEIENPGITIEDTLELVEAISKKQLDYLHVSTMNFWSGSLRDKNDTASRTLLIYEKLNGSIPVIAVGGISTPGDAEKILKTGIPLFALGRELLIEPNWLDKVKNETPELIETGLDVNNQKGLVIPIPMWDSLLTRTGWITLK